MRYQEIAPARILAPLVHHYWVYEKEAHEHRLVHDHVYPEAWPTLAFASGDPIVPQTPSASPGPVWVTAGLTQPVDVVLGGRSRLVGVRLTPSGLPVLLGVLGSEVRGMAAYEEPWALDLGRRLGECPADHVGRVLDRGLFDRLPGLCALSQWTAVETLLTHRSGDVGLDDLITRFGKSRRQFERSLVEGTGYSPGEWRSVYRAQVTRSVLFLRPQLKLVDTALRLGYSDQAHMSRSFKAWSGRSPRDYRDYTTQFQDVFEPGALALSMEREALGVVS